MLVQQVIKYIYQFLPNQGVAVDGVITGGDYPYSLVGVGTDAVITGGGDYTPYWYQNSVANAVERPTQQVQIQKVHYHSSVLKIIMQLFMPIQDLQTPYNTNLGIVSVTTKHL